MTSDVDGELQETIVSDEELLPKWIGDDGEEYVELDVAHQVTGRWATRMFWIGAITGTLSAHTALALLGWLCLP